MLHALLNLFFPPVCAGCDSLLLQNESVICSGCRHEIPLTNHHLQPQNEASTKFFGRIPVESVTAFSYYHKKGIVQEMIHKLKYRGQEDIGTALGYWFAEDLKSVCASADAIVPVPLHPKKLKKRGYNQVTSFGSALSDALRIPMDEKLLRRNFYSKTQTKKNLFARSELSKTLFEADFSEVHHGKHFLLIDDVLTTGSTLEACSRALLKIPNAKISIACLAFSHS
ncbi:ComF family protein [Flavobacterium selenitireducens]|uniref:ComF family protein n=1 Tax=Flavobacterium selenitireducens TaxID=2722704 RepID=UPI00168BF00E|nr:ComF family protein [Flavobacterium selenitireducens]MBD3582133.1 ComF family protein [Flavobacterium selenitireducens]